MLDVEYSVFDIKRTVWTLECHSFQWIIKRTSSSVKRRSLTQSDRGDRWSSWNSFLFRSQRRSYASPHSWCFFCLTEMDELCGAVDYVTHFVHIAIQFPIKLPDVISCKRQSQHKCRIYHNRKSQSHFCDQQRRMSCFTSTRILKRNRPINW